ncbi:MAG TPA: prepilin-type N-terminal cleavage/methylation domain-containing protein [Terriglobales bacterium]|jgi:prepilin-type N-terminal cleavage/methylation domain-containing protein
MSKKRQAGFSLIELLIVVAIILIIAAIAVPNFLRARMAANESSAVASVRDIKTAELMYYNAFPNLGYADKLQYLGGPEPCSFSSTTACMVADPLSNAGVGTGGKSGYIFSALGINTAGTNNDSFVIGAAPNIPGKTGNHLFCSTIDNVTRSDSAPSSTPVTAVAPCLAYTPI